MKKIGNLVLLVLTCIVVFNTLIVAQATWKTLDATTLSWRFEDMYFIDENTGWVVDGGGQILNTTDGGATWTQQFLNSDMYFRSVEFYDDQLGFAGTLSSVTVASQLMKTTDGGETWEDITANLPNQVAGICGMSIADENTIFLTGVFYGSAYVMKSTDQGATWSYTNMSNFCNGMVDIHFTSPEIGFAVGQGNQANNMSALILKTTDGGENWNIAASGEHPNQRAWKLQFINDTLAFASIEEFSPSPQYFKTTDGGETWNLKDIETSFTTGTMQGIGFLNEEKGWIGGFGNLFYETTDGGDSWEYLIDVGTSFNRFFRVSDEKIYGSGTNIYCYTDEPTVSTGAIRIPQVKGHHLSIVGTNVLDTQAEISLDLVNTTYCELSVYNTQGQRLQVITQGRRAKGQYQVSWDCSALSTGQYYLALYTYHGYESIPVFVK